MTQQIYYHFTPVRLSPGSIIQPGNWGRIVQQYQVPDPAIQTFGTGWLIAREMQFELVRISQFPTRPSRMAAAFCCVDEPQARAYQNRVDPNRIQLLHAVELVDPTMATHIAPLSMVDFPPPRSTFIDQTFARATAYWTGLPQGDQEVITASPLRVTANID